MGTARALLSSPGGAGCGLQSQDVQKERNLPPQLPQAPGRGKGAKPKQEQWGRLDPAHAGRALAGSTGEQVAPT